MREIRGLPGPTPPRHRGHRAQMGGGSGGAGASGGRGRRQPLRGFALGLLGGGPGAAGPPSKVQCKRDIMYMQRLFGFFVSFCFFFVLFSFFGFCFSFAVIKPVCMEFLICHTYTHRWALLPCRVKGRLCYATLRMLCSALFFQSCVFFSHFFKGN